MFEKVKEILSEYADAEDIRPESSLTADLGLTSFDMVSLIMEFEETFDIEIMDKDIRKMITVGDIVEYIEQKV